jgi:hypothetical protein
MTKSRLALIAVLIVLAFIPLGMGVWQEHVNNTTPLETFVSGGHEWDVVHSKLCKCHP